MAKSKFNHVKITGISTIVPEKVVNIYDEAEYFDNNIKKIDRYRKILGFYKRHIADNNTTPSDLAIAAAENLISELNIDKNTIDALIYVTHKPDFVSPATAYYIHNKLALTKDCIATDITQSCAGWVFGIYLSSQMIESGVHKKILLLSADLPSFGVNPSNIYYHMFGDAGCATLIEYSKDEVKSYYNIETDSSGFEDIIAPFSGTRFSFNPYNSEDMKLIQDMFSDIDKFHPQYMSIDGDLVYKFAIKAVPKNILDLLEFSSLKRDNINVVCLHQANKQIIQAIASELDFSDDKVPYNAFENYGNTTMCSIPITISMLDNNVSKKNILCCGFGSGLLVAGAILNLENTVISDINSYYGSERTRNDYAQYWVDKLVGEN